MRLNELPTAFPPHATPNEMNKRQKKKREKKIAWDADYREYKKAMELLELQRNGEGYPDPTAYHALRNAMKKGY